MLFFNAVSGIVIWEDWRVIMSWLGYVCTFLLMLLGVYLMSTLELFIFTKKEQTDVMIARHTALLKNEVLALGPERRSSLPMFRRSPQHRPVPRKSKSEVSRPRPFLASTQTEDLNLDDWYLKVFGDIKKQTTIEHDGFAPPLT